MESTGLYLSSSNFVANSTDRINDKVLFGGNDGALAHFGDLELHQSTYGTMADLVARKGPKVHKEFPSNLESRVSPFLFCDGEILVKFVGHAVYQKEAMTKENLPGPKALNVNAHI